MVQVKNQAEAKEQRFRNSEWGPEANNPLIDEVKDFPITFGGTLGDVIEATPKDRISKVMLEEKLFETWHYRNVVLIGDGECLFLFFFIEELSGLVRSLFTVFVVCEWKRRGKREKRVSRVHPGCDFPIRMVFLTPVLIFFSPPSMMFILACHKVYIGAHSLWDVSATTAPICLFILFFFPFFVCSLFWKWHRDKSLINKRHLFPPSLFSPISLPFSFDSLSRTRSLYRLVQTFMDKKHRCSPPQVKVMQTNYKSKGEREKDNTLSLSRQLYYMLC